MTLSGELPLGLEHRAHSKRFARDLDGTQFLVRIFPGSRLEEDSLHLSRLPHSFVLISVDLE
jgi:hypothetical protein